MSAHDVLDDLHLQRFQKRTVEYVYDRMTSGGQERFLVADEVGLGKTKVAQGVMALMTARKHRPNVIYLASSAGIVGQNLPKLRSSRLSPAAGTSLCMLAESAHSISGQIIGLTPIKDLRDDHSGTVAERAMIFSLLKRSHPRLTGDPAVKGFFKGSRASARTFDDLLARRVPGSLREVFEARLDPDLVAAIADPASREKSRRKLIGGLRALLATSALEQLKPALVVVDEIQRYDQQLVNPAVTPQVHYLLRHPLLVLSATPYRADAPDDRHGHGAHRGFLELVDFLNPQDPARTKAVEQALAEMGAALSEKQISRPRVENAVDDLGRQLREFMVRTERPYDAHVERCAVAAELEPVDLKALRQSVEIVDSSGVTDRSKNQRRAQLVELWKSVPYVVSALRADDYKLGKAMETVSGRRLANPAALTPSQLGRQQGRRITEPAHARLRAAQAAMGDDARKTGLWLPPTFPYVADPTRKAEDPPSKTLIFTSWRAAPPAISTTLNLMVESRPEGRKDLEFARHNRRTGKSEPVRSVYLLGAPLWRFGETADPFESVRLAGGPLAAVELVRLVRQQLVDTDVITLSRRAPSQRAVDVALGLNAAVWPLRVPAEQRSYLEPARRLMEAQTTLESAVVTPADGDFLAELAVAAPGTAAYRALRRAVHGRGEDYESGLLSASIAIGTAITRLFQRPGAVAVLKEWGWRMQAPYWRRVLRYCLEHDLQSVLDEYVYLLVQDTSQQNPVQLAQDVAETVEVALSTVGGLAVARPKPKRGTPHGAMHARALGERDSQVDESERGPTTARQRRKRTRHASPLLTAFNSPFPPFVLATTSTGQEGLDMHRYCRRLLHWNLPNSPLALEQREGRVDRFLSLGVRTSIAKLGLPVPVSPAQAGAQPANPWRLLLDAARAAPDPGASALTPLWHFGDGRPIKAIAINIPFSREAEVWDRLQEEANWYRLLLGQPDPDGLLSRLRNTSESNRAAVAQLGLDLRPQ